MNARKARKGRKPVTLRDILQELRALRREVLTETIERIESELAEDDEQDQAGDEPAETADEAATGGES